MFEKTLTDIVKGIRASRRDTSLYISQCIAEIKTEINSSDMFVKANALQKLTFLQMMGYNMGYASFSSIELMSSSRFAHKRIAYLAASQGFNQNTDVILLTTNHLKKELRANQIYEAGLAINCVANIVTEDLGRDLLPELVLLTSHPQPYLRKKAILCLFKVFVKYPQGLRLTFAKIQQCLDDANPSVVSCAVNVITELSDKNPRNYLHLAPSFFQLLTTSSNNWMLIKVVKLLGSLVPQEPRLARKLLDPLADIVRNTKAKSLLYEAVHTITLCLPYCRRSDGSMPANAPEIVNLCAETLQSFVKEQDQNLKYLGLVGFGSLMQSHPRVLSAPGYRPMILKCLSDQDVTIRSRALSLLPGMASRKNLIELVSQLLTHVELATGSYKLDLVAKIVDICSSEKYSLLQDFTWYLNVLFQLGHMRGLDCLSTLLRSQISDVALRVLPVRPYAVRRSIEILLEGEGVCSEDPHGDNGRGRHIMPEILPALAWIVGEYSDLIRKCLSLVEGDTGEEFLLDNTSKGTYHSLIQALTSNSNFQKLPASTQGVCLQAGCKVLAAASQDPKVSKDELGASCETLTQNLPLYLQSIHVEVQERAFTAQSLLASLGLIGGQSLLPGLTDLSSEASDSEKEDDLLGMRSDAPVAKPIKGCSTKSSTSTKLSARASSVLNYVLKPSPMKPTSLKSQRKKSQSPVGIDVTAIDIRVFSPLLDDQFSSAIGMEQVSFTEQSPANPPTSNSTMTTGLPRESTLELTGHAGGLGTVATMSGFQRSIPDAFESAGGGRPNQTDPFYLDSSPKTKTNDDRGPGQFGMIQLSDSDEGNIEATGKKKRKEKKKKKDRKRDASGVVSMGTPGSGVMVYDSDEDVITYTAGPARRSPHKKPGKEFESLAKVDLIQPLREDEVMPERKHHVVADAPQKSMNESPPEHMSKKKAKKNKKENKKASRKKTKGTKGKTDVVGDSDLLGFGLTQTFPSTTESSVNAINDAFDDLLGLAMPTPPTPPTTSHAQVAAPFAESTSLVTGFSMATGECPQPWIRATTKNLDSELSRIPVHFKALRANSSQGSAAVMLVVRVVNGSGNVLSAVTFSLKGHNGVSLGDISPSAVSESGSLGPIMYGGADCSFELKGTLSASGSSVSVKFYMPVSAHLRPRLGLALNDISTELSSPLDSRTVKMILSPATSPSSVKPMLLNFLGAAEVDLGVVGGSGSSATLASQSAKGEKLLFLLKVKSSSVKVDIKCTSSDLGKAVAADLKRLVF